VRTALVIVVPEAEPLVAKLRAQYDNADETGIPAHITLLFPFGDREDGLAELFDAYPPFEFALTEVRRWPDVLWLAPEPEEPFVELTRALGERYPEHPPYEGVHAEVIPHLTVASRQAVPHAVDDDLGNGLPISARATDVVQLEEFAPNRWRERTRFPLGS
jgi:2'-5' RNA ligase